MARTDAFTDTAALGLRGTRAMPGTDAVQVPLPAAVMGNVFFAAPGTVRMRSTEVAPVVVTVACAGAIPEQ